jgi:hypothetical protein
MNSPHSRQTLLRQAFCDLPQSIGEYKLRPLSSGSFELLAEIRNPLVNPEAGKSDLPSILRAVSEYVWIHSADLDTVCAIATAADLPDAELKKIGFSLDIGEALEFTTTFMGSALRLAAAMSEADEEDASPGKPATAPTGSPASSSPAAAPETPPANVTSFGTLPSSAPSPTSTPPLAPEEEEDAGAIPLMILPTLPTTPPEPLSDPCETASAAT